MQFFYENSNISKICILNSKYLKLESENYSKLAYNFSHFLGKGFLIKNSKALDILENMLNVINNLIYLESQIINLDIKYY